MKLVVAHSILSIKDVRYAVVQSIQTNKGETVSVEVEWDDSWGWWPKLKYKLHTWMFGAIYEEEAVDPAYSYKLSLDYIDEQNQKSNWWVQSSNEAQIKGYFDEIKQMLPQLKLQEINHAIMSE